MIERSYIITPLYIYMDGYKDIIKYWVIGGGIVV